MINYFIKKNCGMPMITIQRSSHFFTSFLEIKNLERDGQVFVLILYIFHLIFKCGMLGLYIGNLKYKVEELLWHIALSL